MLASLLHRANDRPAAVHSGHAVEEGPASQSYGLQVASLAGVPKPVVRNARKYLQMLEDASLLRGHAELAGRELPMLRIRWTRGGRTGWHGWMRLWEIRRSWAGG